MKYQIIKRVSYVDTLLYETDSRKEWLDIWRRLNLSGALVRLIEYKKKGDEIVRKEYRIHEAWALLTQRQKRPDWGKLRI